MIPVSPVIRNPFPFVQDGNLLAAGSRDRSITIFDLTKPEARDPQTCRDAIVFADDKTHQVIMNIFILKSLELKELEKKSIKIQ